MSSTLPATTCESRRIHAVRHEAGVRELVRIEDITKTYHLGDVRVPVLHGVSLSIARGEMVALMGASGSGKTTLMNILGCLDRPTSGRFWFDGQDMSRLSPDQRAVVRTTKLGFVFQNFSLLPRTAAIHNVLMPLDYALQRPGRVEARRRAESILRRVGLSSRIWHEPSQMSGGQQQRVAIARALINHPMLVLADEPTGNLDSRTGDDILRLFRKLHAEGITIVLVTHDAKVAAYADRTIRISDGRVVGDANRCSGEAAGSRSGRHADMTGPAAAAFHHLIPQVPIPCGDVVTFAGDPEPPDACDAGDSSDSEGPGLGADAACDNVEGDPKADGLSAPASAPESHGAGDWLPPTFRAALGNLRRNKLRSALTALGVIIGVGAVIAMTEIGEGSKAAIERTIASMGAHKLPIFPSAANHGGVSQGVGTVQTLTPNDVEEIARQCPAVSEVVPMVFARGQVVYGKQNWSPQYLAGTAPRYLVIREWEDLEEGANFTDDDVRTANTVCLIGATLKRELFGDESPIGKTLRVRSVPFRVVGLLSPRGSNMQGQDQDDCLYAPWTTIKFKVNSVGAGSTRAAPAPGSPAINTLSNPYPPPTPLYPQASAAQLAGNPRALRQTNVDLILAKAAGAEAVPLAIEQITQLLRERHRLTEDEPSDFKILNLTEIAEASAETAEMMGQLLLAVAAISLVVGGVGIMNIMLVSVTERTREIGLRMAVGARRHHILQQFLVEAVLLCLVGGALGIAAGRGVSILIREFQHWATQASMPAIVVSVLVAAGVGIVFGFYPAWKASRLDPIEALRHE